MEYSDYIITSLVNTKVVLPRRKRFDRDGIIRTSRDGSHFVVIHISHHVGNADGQIVQLLFRVDIHVRFTLIQPW